MARSGPVTVNSSAVPLGLAQIRVGASAANIAVATPVLAASASIGALANTKFAGNVDYWKLESGFPLLEDLSIPIREAASLECAFKELTPYNMALARGIDPAGAISASETYLDKTSTLGTTDPAKAIAVANDAGPVDDVWTIVFDGAGAYSAYGQDTGHVMDGVAEGAENAIFEPEHNGNLYFTIPADFFTGTWAAEDTYTFRTSSWHAAGAYDSVHAGTINLGSMVAPEFVRMEAVYTYPSKLYTLTVIYPRANVISSAEIDWAAEDTIASPLTFEAKMSGPETSGGNAAWTDAPLGKMIFAIV